LQRPRLVNCCVRRKEARVVVRSVCVYCGSSPGADPAFADAAGEVGRLLAASGRTLVYGGGRVGLMGVVADAALGAGGRVIGVIPQALVDKEMAHHGLSELRVVGSMHERKALMADLSDGFLALPGGIGTMEEFFEVWTWGQLGLHAKPYGLLNVGGFFAPLLAFLDRLVEQRFVRPEHRAMLLVGGDANGLLTDMAGHRPAYAPKWIDRASS
jgi:uncharacterized protein (TIGR00730 family)